MRRDYQHEVAKLSPLESFDASAFIADDQLTQECCDFVLALALVFNDFRDLLLGDQLLLCEAPADQMTPTAALGAFGGAHLHFIRLLLGAIRELLYLVKNASSVRDGALFRTVSKKLSKATRKSWGKVVAAAESSASTDTDIKFLIMARNTVTYHYEAKAIGRGYRRAFADGTVDPYISRGTNVASTRFYFADRAAQSYLEHAFDGQVPERYFLQNSDLLLDIAFSLNEIVTRLVAVRVAWRKAG